VPHKEPPRHVHPVEPPSAPSAPSVPWWAGIAWPERAAAIDPDAPTEHTATGAAPPPPDFYRTNPSAEQLAPGGSYAAPPMSWEEIERSGRDPATFPTFRPRSIYGRTPPPLRIGTIHYSAPPPPAPRMTPPVGQMGQPAPRTHPLAHAALPAALPTHSIVAAWFRRVAPTVPELDFASVRRTTTPPGNPHTPGGVPSVRVRGQMRPPCPPARRYPDWAIINHREYVRIYGWVDVDPRCRGCQAYDRVIETSDYWQEHPVLNLLCIECKNYVYALARASGAPGSGARTEIYRSIEALLFGDTSHHAPRVAHRANAG
jgi:hypothetical protein